MVRHDRRVKTVELALASLAVVGDYVETGCNTGGTAVLMMATLRAFSPESARKLWVADSFQGLPEPTREDAINHSAHRHWRAGQHRATLRSLHENMRRHGMYDDGGQKRIRVYARALRRPSHLPAAPVALPHDTSACACLTCACPRAQP